MLYAALLKWLPQDKRSAPQSPIGPSAPVAAGAPAINDEDQQRRLAAIPGLDLNHGRAMMRGNMAKYTRLLVLFADGNHQQADQISGMLAAGELAAIESIAHSLKGSAGMLGARNVSEAAGAVLSALHGDAGNGEISELCAVLTEALSGLIDGIRQATVGLAEVAGAEVDATRFAEVLTRLENLLEQGDMAATDLAKDEAGLLRAALGQAARSLLARIEAFDYENAAAELKALKSRRSARRHSRRIGRYGARSHGVLHKTIVVDDRRKSLYPSLRNGELQETHIR